jgi:hypothetical protein
MEPHEKEPFFELVDATCDAISMRQPLTAGAKQLLWEDLLRYPFELVRAALAAHRQDKDRGQWQPNTAHVEYQIDRRRRNNWLSADEAFARLSFDDRTPVLLNQVTAAALAVAAPFMEQARPDQNAARMAFRACYERLVAVEKLDRRAPNYWISPAGSQEAREALQAEAARQGLLTVVGKPFVTPDAAPLQLAAPSTEQRAKFRAALAGLKMKSLPPPGDEE